MSDAAAMRHEARRIVTVQIDVRQGSDAITRVTGPDGDEWRRDMYPLHTQEDVLDMWADNCVRNCVNDASLLDGWGDLEAGEVTMVVTDSYPSD